MSYRNICGTLNNHTDEELLKLRNWKRVSYGVIGQEVGESGTPHLQLYLEFNNSIKHDQIKKHSKRLHFEKRHGNQQQAIDYCKKDGNFIEWGEPSKQGDRTDLKYWTDAVRNGTLSIDEILIENPMVYHQYGRTLLEAEKLYIKTLFRNWDTTAEWYYGPTGVGKTYNIRKRINELGYNHRDRDQVYQVKLHDKGWWDGYHGQPIIIFNEFRGNIPYSHLLQMINSDELDEFFCPRRNREPFPFLGKHIFFSSPESPEQVYSNLSTNDSIDQLLRRLVIFWLPKKAEVVKRGNTSPFASRKLDDDDDGNSDLSTTPVARYTRAI